MADSAKLAKQRGKGSAADRLRKDQAFQDACQKIEETILDRWRNSPGDDQEGRENAYRLLRLLANLREQLVRTAATGRVAADELLKT